MSENNNIATTIACCGNLYLSEQLDIDEWTIYTSQFRKQAFQFYNTDGQLKEQQADNTVSTEVKNEHSVIGVVVIVLVGYAFYNIVRYLFSNNRWMILAILLLAYLLIK